jgi:hypothetical protein
MKSVQEIYNGCWWHWRAGIRHAQGPADEGHDKLDNASVAAVDAAAGAVVH